MKKSNKKKLIVPALLALLIMIIGVSYAAFNYSFIGGVNTISSSEISIDLLESNSEIINITNALPMSDNDGKTQTDTFDFAVTSKTPKTTVIGYILNIEKLTVDSGYTSLNDSDIKIYLEDYAGNQLLEPTKISDLDNYKFYSNLHNHDSSHVTIQDKFKLRAWINPENVNAFEWDQTTKLQYKFKIGLSSTETTPLTVNAVVSGGTITGSTSKPVMNGGSATFVVTPTNSTSEAVVSCTNSQTGTIKNNTLTVSNVTSDTTCTVTFSPASTVLYTDGTLIINEKASDRSTNITTHGAVTNEYVPLSNQNAYVFNNTISQPWNSKKSSVTSVEIGQKIEPTNTANWFNGLNNMTTGDFTNLDTKNVTSMGSMFLQAGYASLVTTFELTGLDNWNTSNVTNMGGMFAYAGRNATTWSIGNLSNWNTSNATNMSSMFEQAGYNALTFDISYASNWDTSNATNMSYMFQQAGYNATTFDLGDLSNWDTSKVINMSYMFQQAGYNATTFDLGDLSNWDTSKVTDMHSMFYWAGRNSTTWSVGRLLAWDTSQVADMTGMFNEAGYNATSFSLNLSGWDVSNVTNMYRMFEKAAYNSMVWNIGDLSNWNTSNVENMRFMFNKAGHSATTWNSIGILKIYATNISDLFYDCVRAKATLNIYSNPTNYNNAFTYSTTGNDALITINYSSATTNIDNIIATKDSNSNVVKGVQLD